MYQLCHGRDTKLAVFGRDHFCICEMQGRPGTSMLDDYEMLEFW
jgi:hypothetical protein